MKTMRERWICPDMDVQVFTPQEFVAACEMTVIGHEIVINTETEAFLPAIHMILDIHEDKLWTQDDHDQVPNQTYTSDNNQPQAGSTLIYTGQGWALNGNGNIDKPSKIPVGTNFNTPEYLYVAAFMKTGTTNMHVYAADWKNILAKNQS